MIAEVGFKGLWVVARYLPALLLRRYFTAERLAGLVHVDIVARHDPVTLNLAAPSTANVYVEVINLGPTPITLEQAEFRLTSGSVWVKFTVVRKQRFEVGAIGVLILEQTLQDSQAQAIAGQLQDLRVALDGRLEFSSAIRAFPRDVQWLDGIRPRVLNQNFWTSQAA